MYICTYICIYTHVKQRIHLYTYILLRTLVSLRHTYNVSACTRTGMQIDSPYEAPSFLVAGITFENIIADSLFFFLPLSREQK